MQNSLQKFAKDLVITSISNTLVALSKFILLPLLTKTLGTHDYGIWAQVNVTVSLILGFVGLGLPFALSRFLAAKNSNEDIQDEFYSVLALVFLTSSIVSSLIFLFSTSIANLFFEGEIQIVKLTSFIILVWSLDTLYLSLFRAFRQMRKHAVFLIAQCYGETGLIVYLALSGYGLFNVIFSVLAVRGFLLLTLFFIIKCQIGIGKPHFSRIREYLSFSLPTILGNIAAWIAVSSDKYVIGYFLGASSVGVYSAAYALGDFPLLLAAVLSFVMPPTLSKLYDENRLNEVKTCLSYSLKYFLCVAIPYVFGAIVLAKPVLKLCSTSEIANRGYFVVPLIAFSMLCYGSFSIIANILVLVKKTRVLGLIWTSAAVVNLGLNILLVPWLGLFGASLAAAISNMVAFIIGGYYSFKELKFPIDWRSIVKSLSASSVTALAACLMHPRSNLDTAVTILAGISVYAVSLLLLKGVTRKEISFFQGLFRPKKILSEL